MYLKLLNKEAPEGHVYYHSILAPNNLNILYPPDTLLKKYPLLPQDAIKKEEKKATKRFFFNKKYLDKNNKILDEYINANLEEIIQTKCMPYRTFLEESGHTKYIPPDKFLKEYPSLPSNLIIEYEKEFYVLMNHLNEDNCNFYKKLMQNKLGTKPVKNFFIYLEQSLTISSNVSLAGRIKSMSLSGEFFRKNSK